MNPDGQRLLVCFSKTVKFWLYSAIFSTFENMTQKVFWNKMCPRELCLSYSFAVHAKLFPYRDLCKHTALTVLVWVLLD